MLEKQISKGAAGQDAKYTLGVMAIQEEKENGKIRVTNMKKSKGPIKDIDGPDLSNIKAYDGINKTKHKENKDKDMMK